MEPTLMSKAMDVTNKWLFSYVRHILGMLGAAFHLLDVQASLGQRYIEATVSYLSGGVYTIVKLMIFPGRAPIIVSQAASKNAPDAPATPSKSSAKSSAKVSTKVSTKTSQKVDSKDPEKVTA